VVLVSFVLLYQLVADDGNVEVYNVGTTVDGELDVITGYAYQPHPETEPGMLTVVFGGRKYRHNF
jgi:hypothetical protein